MICYSFEPTKTNQEEEYRQVFQLLDSDNDGLISTQDLTKVKLCVSVAMVAMCVAIVSQCFVLGSHQG